MILDCIIIATIFVWAVFGYRKGFVHQLFIFLAILAVGFFAAPLAQIITQIITKEFDLILTGRFANVLLLSATSATLWIIVILIGRFLRSTLVKGLQLAEKLDHILGTITAIVASCVAIYFVLCTFSTLKPKTQEYAPAVQTFFDKSKCYQFSDHNNALLEFDAVKNFIPTPHANPSTQNELKIEQNSNNPSLVELNSDHNDSNEPTTIAPKTQDSPKPSTPKPVQ